MKILPKPSLGGNTACISHPISVIAGVNGLNADVNAALSQEVRCKGGPVGAAVTKPGCTQSNVIVLIAS